MRLSRVLVGAVGVAVVLMLSGCAVEGEEPLPVPPPNSVTPSVEPAPEYTPGVDADADVAAAIATYEAYVAASNELVVADRDTWDPVLELTTGRMREASESSFEDMNANGRELQGDAHIASASLAGTQEELIVLDACLDVSDTDVLDSSGESTLDPERASVSWLRVRLVAEDGQDNPWQIEHIAFREDGPQCEL